MSVEHVVRADLEPVVRGIDVALDPDDRIGRAHPAGAVSAEPAAPATVRHAPARHRCEVLDDTARAGRAVVALCPYVEAFVQRHPEYRDATVPARPEHLDAVARR